MCVFFLYFSPLRGFARRFPVPPARGAGPRRAPRRRGGGDASKSGISGRPAPENPARRPRFPLVSREKDGFVRNTGKSGRRRAARCPGLHVERPAAPVVRKVFAGLSLRKAAYSLPCCVSPLLSKKASQDHDSRADQDVLQRIVLPQVENLARRRISVFVGIRAFFKIGA